MNNKTLALLVILFFSAIQPAFCAFPVRNSRPSAVQPSTVPALQNYKHSTRHLSRSSARVARVADACRALLYPEKLRKNTNGTLALIFGITGLLFPPLSIPAVIFAAIGLKHDEQYSVAGLILGIIGLIYLTILVLAMLIFG